MVNFMIDTGFNENFKLIFNNIIKPIIFQIESKIDRDFFLSTGFHLNNLDEICNKCSTFYEQKKDELKKIFYGDKISKTNEISGEQFLFDIHKVASITCYSLIKNKVFSFDENKAIEYMRDNSKTDTTWIINNVLANYKLAFHVSTAFIYYKLLFDATKQGDKALVEKIKKQNKLFLYKTRDGHESFENSVILDFAKRDIHKRSFDYFLYSAFLFQLEEYNREIFDKF